MSSDYEVIARSLTDKDSPVFLVDEHFQIMRTGLWFEEHVSSFTAGASLYDLFPGCFEELRGSFEKLKMGSPVYSTNFEINLQKASVFMLPCFEQNKLSCIFCYLEPLHYRDSISTFLPVLSDRYRSPALNILNILSTLAPKFQTDEDYKGLDCLNEAARSCYCMLRNASSVRDYYLLVNKHADFHLKGIILNEFMDNICKTLQVLFTSTHRVLNFKSAADTIITSIDERLFSLAMFHLISNACIYSPAEAPVEVSLQKQGNIFLISVTDQGIGIPQEELEHIFDPFYSRREIPVPEEEMGLGLGLSITKKIVKLHQGRIFVTSKRNEGTTVLLHLPVLSPNEHSAFASHSTRYVTDRFSDAYLLFADICKITFF